MEALRRAAERWIAAEERLALTSAGTTERAAGEAEKGFYAHLRVARGEVAAEQLVKTLGSAGRATKPAEAVFDRLGRLAAENPAAARAQVELAKLGGRLKPEEAEALLAKVDGILRKRSGAAAELADLMTAAARAKNPTAFLDEVAKLVDRNLSKEALATLGAKATTGKVDVAWLNATKLSDAHLDFLARDKRTPWDLFRRAAENPADVKVMIGVRRSLRGAAGEVVAEPVAGKLGTGVRRQVPMGSSEIDYAVTVRGKEIGLEVKGWTPETLTEAIDAAWAKNVSKRALTAAEEEALKKFDHMIGQLESAKTATGQAPYLAVTGDLKGPARARLEGLLKRKVSGTKLLSLDEAKIKGTAADLGEAMGIPRP
jgi:hypothetical protein